MKTKFILGILMLVALVSLTSARPKIANEKCSDFNFEQVSHNIAETQKMWSQFMFARAAEAAFCNMPAPCDNYIGNCQYDSQVTWGGCIYDIYHCFNEFGDWYCSRLFGC